MTSSSITLANLAHSFAARVGAADERVDSIILRGSFGSSDEQAAWLNFRDDVPAPFRSIQIYDPEISGDLSSEEAFDPERRIQITIIKPERERLSTFLFATAAAEFIRSGAPAGRILSYEMEARGEFQTRGLEVAIWNLDSEITSPPEALRIEPRQLVKDYVPSREIAEDISPWMIVSKPAVVSPEFEAWRAQAGRRLLGALVNSAELEENVVWLKFSGPPIFRIRAEDDISAKAWEELTACAEWVFLSGSDIEVRHLIFAAELARAGRNDSKLSAILLQALEAAKSTYEAHVRSASRETLKALADLRKTVIDETQRVTQRAQDLTGGLWRDVAVSVAAFVIKAAGDASKATNPETAANIYFAAAIFIAISFFLQIRIHQTYLNDQRKARERWLRTLYGYISSSERKEIAEEPIRKAEESYREIRAIVGLVYLVLVVILVIFGGQSLHDHAHSESAGGAAEIVSPAEEGNPSTANE